MQKIFNILILFIAACNNCIAQNNRELDSLRHELVAAQEDSSRATLLNEIGDRYPFSNPDSALFYAQEALILSRQAGFSKGEAVALNHLGFAHEISGNFPKAMEYHLRCLQIAEKEGFMLLKGQSLQRIGGIYRETNDYVKALSYLKQSKKIFDSIKSPMSVSSENMIGHTYYLIDNLDSALYFCQQAYDNLVRFKVEWMRTPTLGSLGVIYTKKGNYGLALNYLRQSLGTAYNEDNYLNSAQSNREIADVYKQMNKIDSAVYYGQKAIAEAQQGKFYSEIIEAGELLAEIYKQEEPARALEYKNIIITAKDNLFNSGKINALQNLTSFDERERQYEIDTAKTAYRNQVKQYAMLAGTGIVLLIAFVFYRNNNQKKKANKKLENTLSHLRATQSQLIQSEKMASLGELTAGIAHEIQNPLNFVNNFSDVNTELIEELKTEKAKVKDERDEQVENELLNDIAENEKKINHHGKRADAIVKGMLQHSRISTGVKEPTDINALADEYLRLSYHGMRGKDHSFNVTMKTDFDESIGKINITPQDIGRVLLNLYNNAFYAVNEKKKLLPENYEPVISVTTKKIEDKIEVKVKDNGNGIPQNIVDKIFQPFFTTKPTGQGTGLGLSLAYDIVKAHGGELKLQTKEEEGSIFIIVLPVI